MFQRSTITESWFCQHGVQFEYIENMAFTDLTPDWKRINFGRPDDKPIDEDLCLNYSESMRNGAVFPAPILANTAAGQEVLDGAQRLFSWELLDGTQFNGYVLKTISSEVRQKIRTCANTILNGKRESDTFTVSRVVDILHEKQRMSLKECSLWSGIALRVLEEEKASRVGRQKLIDIGVDVQKKPASNKQFQVRWSEICKDEWLEDKRTKNALHHAVEHMQQAKCNNGESMPILKKYELKEKKGVHPATQIQSVTAVWVEEQPWKGRMQGPTKRTPVDKVVTALKTTETVAKDCRAQHSDREQSVQIVALLKSVKGLCRRIVPREDWESDGDIVV